MSPFGIRIIAALGGLVATSACAVSSFPAVPAPVEVAPAAPVETAPPPRPKPDISLRRMSDAEPATAAAATPAVASRPVEVEVGPGHSIFTIAEEHGVAISALIEANDLADPFALSIGQTLEVPPANTYEVRPGDTLYSIAARHRVDHRSLALMNELDEPYTIYAGQTIYLPSLAKDQTQPIVAAARADGGQAIPVAERAPASPASPPDFHWPLTGRLISRFETVGATQNAGVNIAVVEGEPVRAAASGHVTFAQPFQGYGKVVLIEHGRGWASLYGHNRRLHVAKNQRVKMGEIIAEAGSTGAVDTPQLHFELRQRGTPVDPLEHLPMM